MFINKYANYNLWANSLLLDVVMNFTDEDMRDREIISSFPSLRKTVFHLWDAEFIWLKRLKGESPGKWPSKEFTGSMNEAKESILANGKEFFEFVERLDTHQILSHFEYRNIEGKKYSNPVWEAVMHCVNHSTYHRGQMVTILRQLGISSIPSTDFIAYCRIVS